MTLSQFLLNNLDKVEEYSYTLHTTTSGMTDRVEEYGYMLHTSDLSRTIGSKCPDFLAYTTFSNHKLVLDSAASTVNLITEQGLLHGIHRVKRGLHMQCNVGVSRINLMGYLRKYPNTVWFNPKGVASILSLFLVKTSTGFSMITTLRMHSS